METPVSKDTADAKVSATLRDIDLASDATRLVKIERDCFGIEAYRLHDLWYWLRQGYKFRAAVVDGNIVGYSMAMKQWQAYHIGNMAVLKDFQRHGVGQVLFDDVLQTGRNEGCLCSRLEVAANNEVAKRFYLKNGFVQYGVNPHYYPDGADALLMQKDFK
jgi:ribosomal protein S18 acetylase RimI-like enzyme